MTRTTRPVSWIKAALKEFEAFPPGAQTICLAALTIAAEGGKADIAKPMQVWARAYSRLRSLSEAMHSV
jgi:phage-related protein